MRSTSVDERGRNRRHPPGSDKGIALLVVLWLIVILTAIVFSFSFLTRTETHAALSFGRDVEEEFLAEAGMKRAVAEILRRSTLKGGQAAAGELDIVRVDGTVYSGALGDDLYTYSISDESGKINLNSLTDASGLILDNLLVNRGVSKEQADTIVSSILDWRDPDEAVRLNGAESDYYMSLPEPYKSKNAPLDSVEELEMVKGMTPVILHGGDGRQGIFDSLTVYSKAQAINVNAAPREVLAAIPGMGTEIIEAIMAARLSPAGVQMADLQSMAGGGLGQAAAYITFSESNTYTIEATGYKKGAKQGLTIRATVFVGTPGSLTYLYYKNPAGVKRIMEQAT